MPPLPKEDGELLDPRSARDARRAPATNLPAAGHDGPYPSPPDDLDDDLVGSYVALWRSPMGAAWVVEDADLVVELVTLRRLVTGLLADGKEPKGTTFARVGVLETALGLTPKSRASMRWRVVDTDPDLWAADMVRRPDDLDPKPGGFLEQVLAEEAADA